MAGRRYFFPALLLASSLSLPGQVQGQGSISGGREALPGSGVIRRVQFVTETKSWSVYRKLYPVSRNGFVVGSCFCFSIAANTPFSASGGHMSLGTYSTWAAAVDSFNDHVKSINTCPGPCQQPMGLPETPTQGQNTASTGKFESRWDKIDGPGGAWSTGWVRNHTQPICGHLAPGCSGPDGNFCGIYNSGQIAYWWPKGNQGPRWTIRCISKPQVGSVRLGVIAGSQSRDRASPESNPVCLDNTVRPDQWAVYWSAGYGGSSRWAVKGRYICRGRNWFDYVTDHEIVRYECPLNDLHNCRRNNARSYRYRSTINRNQQRELVLTVPSGRSSITFWSSQ